MLFLLLLLLVGTPTIAPLSALEGEYKRTSRLLQELSKPLLQHLSAPTDRLHPRSFNYTRDLLPVIEISSQSGKCTWSHDPCSLYGHIVDLPTHKTSLAQYDCKLIESSNVKLNKIQENVFSSSNNHYFQEAFRKNKDVAKTCANQRQKRLPESRNIILTMAYTYGCRRISLFLRTLRATGSNAEVYIYTGRLEPDFCSNVISMCGNVTFVQEDRFTGVKHEIRRYIQALQWLYDNIVDHLDPCTQILIVDARDTVFQADPFNGLSHVGAQLVLTEEGYAHESLMYYHGNYSRVTLGNDNSGMNQKWVKFLLKQIFKDFLSCGFKLMEDKPIINSGIIMGTPLAMMKLLYFVATVGSYLDLNEKYAAGQGILNFVYYFGMLKDMDMKILPPLLTPFVHLTSFIPEFQNSSIAHYHPKSNPYVNFLKQPYAIIHQIDRKHILEKVWKWQQPTWHTQHRSCTEI